MVRHKNMPVGMTTLKLFATSGFTNVMTFRKLRRLSHTSDYKSMGRYSRRILNIGLLTLFSGLVFSAFFTTIIVLMTTDHGFKSINANRSHPLRLVDSARPFKRQSKTHKNSYTSHTIRNITSNRYRMEETSIPFVIMTYNRLDYLKEVIQSLMDSDFPRHRVPLIISHDGHIIEMMDYVKSLHLDFPHLTQLIHPHSCYDHPNTFPGNDRTLNVNYSGDAYGNARSSTMTCCKHHFTWLMTTVFHIPDLQDTVDTFLFLEEDYIVAPTIYKALIGGLNAINQFDQYTNHGIFGLSLDPILVDRHRPTENVDPNAWYGTFFTGPMTLNRQIFQKIQNHADVYCGLDGYDEYNWDHSLTHMQSIELIPHSVFAPMTPLAKHIGLSRGMHVKQEHDDEGHYVMNNTTTRLVDKFLGTTVQGDLSFDSPIGASQGWGGWGHPADQQHCMNLFQLVNRSL